MLDSRNNNLTKLAYCKNNIPYGSLSTSASMFPYRQTFKFFFFLDIVCPIWLTRAIFRSSSSLFSNEIYWTQINYIVKPFVYYVLHNALYMWEKPKKLRNRNNIFYRIVFPLHVQIYRRYICILKMLKMYFASIDKKWFFLFVIIGMYSWWYFCYKRIVRWNENHIANERKTQ